MDRISKNALVAKAAEQGVSLDGKPAVLFGAGLPFAQVALKDGSAPVVEYSWAAAAKIVAKGGAFQS